jgi:2-methylcitrate dehydratase
LKPQSKETADHSFHYCVAVALAAGEVTARQFEQQWLDNPALKRLIDKTTLEAREDLTVLFQNGARPAALEIKTAQGIFYREVLYPRGDPKNPMLWDDVEKKFNSQTNSRFNQRTAHEIVERVMALEKENNMAELVKLMCNGHNSS